MPAPRQKLTQHVERILPILAPFILIFLVVCGLWLWFSNTPQSSPSQPEDPKNMPDRLASGVVVSEMTYTRPANPETRQFPGDQDLAGFGSPNQSPKQDLEQLSRSLQNFLLLHKSAADRPLSANEEWARALRGVRPGTNPWISPSHPLFSADGRLCDRHGTPLVFHALGKSRWQIRSAGQDQIPWTPDDMVFPDSTDNGEQKEF